MAPLRCRLWGKPKTAPATSTALRQRASLGHLASNESIYRNAPTLGEGVFYNSKCGRMVSTCQAGRQRLCNLIFTRGLTLIISTPKSSGVQTLRFLLRP